MGPIAHIRGPKLPVRSREVEWCCALALVSVLFPALLFVSTCALGGEERYDYDLLGRLIRVVDEQGRVTEYDYDAAGNILAVRRVETRSPPTVSAQDLGVIRQGEIRKFVVSGSGLSGLVLRSSNPLVSLSSVRIGASELAFTLTAQPEAPLGSLELYGTNSLGGITFNLRVAPLVSASAVPTPLAIPPDGQPYQAHLILSDAFLVEIPVQITVVNASLALAPAPVVTVAPGQTLVPFRLLGVSEGETAVVLSSVNWVTPVRIPLIVASDYQKYNRRASAPIGIVKGSPTDLAQPVPSAPLLTPPVGIVRGNPTVLPESAPSGPLLAPHIGIVRGDPTALPGPVPASPLLAPAVGISKQ